MPCRDGAPGTTPHDQSRLSPPQHQRSREKFAARDPSLRLTRSARAAIGPLDPSRRNDRVAIDIRQDNTHSTNREAEPYAIQLELPWAQSRPAPISAQTDPICSGIHMHAGISRRPQAKELPQGGRPTSQIVAQTEGIPLQMTHAVTFCWHPTSHHRHAAPARS